MKLMKGEDWHHLQNLATSMVYHHIIPRTKGIWFKCYHHEDLTNKSLGFHKETWTVRKKNAPKYHKLSWCRRTLRVSWSGHNSWWTWTPDEQHLVNSLQLPRAQVKRVLARMEAWAAPMIPEGAGGWREMGTWRVSKLYIWLQGGYSGICNRPILLQYQYVSLSL